MSEQDLTGFDPGADMGATAEPIELPAVIEDYVPDISVELPPMPQDLGADVGDEGGEPPAPGTVDDGYATVEAPEAPEAVAPAPAGDAAPTPQDVGAVSGDEGGVPPEAGTSSGGEGGEPVAPEGDPGVGDNVVGLEQPQTEEPVGAGAAEEPAPTPQDVGAVSGDEGGDPPAAGTSSGGEVGEPVEPEGDPGSGTSVIGAGQPGWDAQGVQAVDTSVTSNEVQALGQLTGATPAADPCATLAEALERLGAKPAATSADVAAALAAANERPVLIVDRDTPQAPVYRVERAESAQVLVVPLTGGDPAALPLDDLALAAESAQDFELPGAAIAAGLTVVAVGGGLAAALAYKFASRATS